MEINDLLGLGKTAEVVGSGVERLYDDFVGIPLALRRLEGKDNLSIEFRNEGYRIEKKLKETNLSELSFLEQKEIFEMRNQIENLNNLCYLMNEKVKNVELVYNKIKNIDQNILLYLLEKYKYISQEDQAILLNTFIINKIENEDDVSKGGINFIDSLSVNEIKKLQEIKKLMFDLYQICFNAENSLTPFELEGRDSGEKSKKGKRLLLECIFPYLQGDSTLENVDIDVRWTDIQDFAMRGLFTSTSMIKILEYKNKIKNEISNYYLIYYGDKKYVFDSKKKI